MIGKYKVKSGTWVVPQISVVLTDDKVFKDPKEFVPERFIGEDGKLKTIPEFIPFSLGKRQCIGEALGKMELFLFVANLLNQYIFMPGDQKPSLERRAGFTVRLDNFNCRPVRRFT
jgi:cytochrome P450